jgi:excisionase family DNA binding protein
MTIRTGHDARPARTAVGRRGAERPVVDADRRMSLDAPAMRLSEVARRLAISRAGAYRLVRAGQLPGIQVGRTWRVLRSDFEAYLDAQRSEAERRYRAAQREP